MLGGAVALHAHGWRSRGGGVQLTALPSPVTAAALSEEAAALFHPALLKIPLPILIPLLFWVLFRAGSRK